LRSQREMKRRAPIIRELRQRELGTLARQGRTHASQRIRFHDHFLRLLAQLRMTEDDFVLADRER